MAATATVAYFVIHPRRGWQGLQRLLGEVIRGIICSDRWRAYAKLLVEARLLCWAQTLRLQQRPVLDYLYRVVVAHRSGSPAPALSTPQGD